MENFLFDGKLTDIDEAVDLIIKLETQRQKQKLIMIASESFAPESIRESLGSSFQNIYAEGYPDEATRRLTENEILDLKESLGHFRRMSDARYYKGVEYVDVVEELARRRCAEAFTNERVPISEIDVNVQPLSGAPANNAVYHLIAPGDTVLTMDLLHGGHLTHGSPVNRTGELYNIVHYTVDPTTEKLDYDEIHRIALSCMPKMIIAGYTSYPYIPDWKRYREIADSVGAILMADIAHIAGLVAANTVESPVGYADVISFTTHKGLSGPRGACIITTNPKYTKIIDKAVFPGEQGGPHAQVFAALCTTFKIAQTEDFKRYQQAVLDATQIMIQRFKERGLKVAYNGSDSHMLLLDCKSIVGADGTTLSGDIAARILDLAGIVLNRNTIPGDRSALRASGIRMGMNCLIQMGMKPADIYDTADIIADVLLACHPYSTPGAKGSLSRSRVDFDVLQNAKIRVRKICAKFSRPNNDAIYGYPNFYYADDCWNVSGGVAHMLISGRKARSFVNYAFLNDAEVCGIGEFATAEINVNGKIVKGSLLNRADGYQFSCDPYEAGITAEWLRALSDGFAKFDNDLRKRLPGTVYITECEELKGKPATAKPCEKAWAIGKNSASSAALPEFIWVENENAPLRSTPLAETHKALGGKMVAFAGWNMPVWYTSIKEEHAACRNAGGLFDVAHMGVYLASGSDAQVFLDSVCANAIGELAIGETCYTHLLSPDANVIDDLIVYCIDSQKYFVVVNASNDDKDWAWLNAVRGGKVLVDRQNPGARAFGRGVTLENLRDVQAGERMRVDLALQGKISVEVLIALGGSKEDIYKIEKLKKGNITHVTLGGFDLYAARTGYTGEKISFELFVHPDKLVDLWNRLLEIGTPLGLKPCGLGARDSLRTEAGLPLYGHEMAGEMNLKVNEAGFSSFVKTYKCWFIGSYAYRRDEVAQKKTCVRFQFTEKSVRMAHYGDPILDAKGKVIGRVTSCACDKDGYIMGLASLELKFSSEGTQLFIYQGSDKAEVKQPADLTDNARTTLPCEAKVISRFPRL